MKIKNIIFFVSLATPVLFAQSGEEIFTKYCSHCHAKSVGVSVDVEGEYREIYDAPYVKDVVSKLKSKTKNQEEFTAFIKDYINNPDKRKSLYGKRAIKNFGLMPSLKGVLSDEESTQLAEYLYEKFDTPPHK